MLLGAVRAREGDIRPPSQPCWGWRGRCPEPAGVVGSTCSAGLSTSGVSAWRGLFPIGAAQAALAHVAGESLLLVLGCRGEVQCLGAGGQAALQNLQPWERGTLWQGVILPQHPARSPGSPALCPTSLHSCPSCHQLWLPPAPQGVLAVLKPAAAGWARGSRCSKMPGGV